jgi:uncharacterized cupredoxin-like copper-binding protein
MKRSFGLLLVLLGLLASGALAGTANEVSADEKSPAAPAAGAVEVHLSEYSIKLPDTLPAGPTTFVLHNDGHKNHIFKIQGPGIEETQSSILEPHGKGELKVTLQPGEYKILCPVGSHSAKGMTTKLVVTAKKEG